MIKLADKTSNLHSMIASGKDWSSQRKRGPSTGRSGRRRLQASMLIEEFERARERAARHGTLIQRPEIRIEPSVAGSHRQKALRL
jgi:hypothetical protein